MLKSKEKITCQSLQEYSQQFKTIEVAIEEFVQNLHVNKLIKRVTFPSWFGPSYDSTRTDVWKVRSARIENQITNWNIKIIDSGKHPKGTAIRFPTIQY